MRPSRFSDEEIRQALERVTSGTPAVQVCRELAVTQTTFYRWRKKFADNTPGVATADEWHEARTLRDENRMLKQIIAELVLVNRSALEYCAKRA